tara:strand:- start:3873 stop:4697 length:825 start_codon:yes stop_codon:yes gene_type:complete
LSFFKKIKKAGKLLLILRGLKRVKRIRKANGDASVKVGDKEVKDNPTTNDLIEASHWDGKVVLSYPTPSDVQNFKAWESATEAEIDNAIAQMQNFNIEDDPTDMWMESFIGNRSVTSIPEQVKKDTTPDSYKKGWYPATSKPNIEAIKFWVEHVKIAGMSDDEIIEEYYKERDTPNMEQFMSVTDNFKKYMKTINFSPKEHKRNPLTTKRLLIDSIAYRVSRKLWYVGRKPNHMTDYEWNEHTKNMRPAEGSYGQNDEWVDFKYTVNYKYHSGE